MRSSQKVSGSSGAESLVKSAESPIVLDSSPEPDRSAKSEDLEKLINKEAEVLMDKKPHLMSNGIMTLLRVRLMERWSERVGVPNFIENLLAVRDIPPAQIE